jgi:hypothetical protein
MRRILVILGVLLVAGQAQAREADWGIGLGAGMPYFFKPASEMGDTSLGIQGEWMPSSSFSLRSDWSFALNGYREVMGTLGPRAYLLSGHDLRPFLEASGMIQVHPRMDGGFRVGVGISWALRPLFGSDRARIEAGIGAGVLVRSPRSLFVDLYRVGLMFYY